jgi:Flp pilus assembly protein TadG
VNAAAGRAPGLRWRTDRHGAVAVLGAISMTAIVGVAGLALDLGAAYAQKAGLQMVADSAALAGAISWVKTGSTTAVIQTINDVVVANGLSASVIQHPSSAYMASSPKNASSPAIQVSLSKASSLTLAHVVSTLTSVTTTAYSAVEIASVTGSSSTAPACMLALTTLMINGSVNVNGCAAEANSTASNAITVNSGGVLTASSIDTPGKISASGGTINGTIVTGAPAATNPYSAYASAASAGFTGCQNYNNQTTLSPGCYSNVNIGSGVTLNPGTYFFTGININSGGSLTGTGGVTIVTQQQFSPNDTITITAPTSGPWDGMAIYAMAGMNINSGVTFDVNGAIYVPTGGLIPNSATWNQNACTYIVASSITFNSGAAFTLPQNNCSSYNYTAPSIAGPTTTTTTIALVK